MPVTRFPCPLGNTSSPACRRNFPKPYFSSKASAVRGTPRKTCLRMVECNGPIRNFSKIIPAATVAWYLDYANRQNERIGAYVHYSETHDNSRLAEKGPRVVALAKSPLRAD